MAAFYLWMIRSHTKPSKAVWNWVFFKDINCNIGLTLTAHLEQGYENKQQH
jgi:hypothetical protein